MRDTSEIHEENSRGGKQNFKAEECVWKRLSKDGKHYRIIQHSTGYFYQQGLLPSDTAEPDEDEGVMRGRRRSMRARASPRARARSKKKKLSPHPRRRREARKLRHLPRHLRQLRTRPRRRPRRRPRAHPSAHPSAASSRARDTYPRMYPLCIRHVSDMYH